MERGVDPHATGVLVDEQFGSDIPKRAKEQDLVLSMPVEKSGQDEFDFQYGADFGEHIKKFDVHFAKVLVRFNPDGDQEMNARQLARLKELADWLHANDGKFLFELLVPAEQAQLDAVGGDSDRYDAELRPELMRRAIEATQDYGCEVDIWKIEGVDTREDCEMLAKQARTGEGREGVVCVLLGRGASDEKVDHWLRQAAPVEGFVGFAIGRSIWWDALKGFLDGKLERGAAADQIADQLPPLRAGLQRGGVGRAGLTRRRRGGGRARGRRRPRGGLQPATSRPPPPPGDALTGEVVRVTDGDTVRVRIDSRARGARPLHRDRHARGRPRTSASPTRRRRSTSGSWPVARCASSSTRRSATATAACSPTSTRATCS